MHMIYELVYYSSANKDVTQEDIEAILHTAREFNSAKDVTGCLLYFNNEFIQLLEGDEKIVRSLFSSIMKDSRHSEVILLAQGGKADRTFNNWSMAFHKLTKEEVYDLDEKVFVENFTSFAEMAKKPTFPTILFWNRASQLLGN
ncbi:MAG: BLUF domain-containing protein [Ginsengibacter sp.]